MNNNPLVEFQRRRRREEEKALLKIFTNRIKESFLREIHHKMYEMHPDFLTKFDLRYDYVQNATGNDDWQFDYEIYRSIVGIHRFVEYAQTRSNSPTDISTYETKLIDKKLLQKKLIEYQKAFDDKD